MSKLYKVSEKRSCENSIPHATLGLWFNPVDICNEHRALDDLMDTYWDDGNEKINRHSPIVIKILDAIKAGKIHNVTWSK